MNQEEMGKVSLSKSDFDRLVKKWYDGEFQWIEYHPPQEYQIKFYWENEDGGDVDHAGKYDLELEELEIYDDFYVKQELLEDIVNDILKEAA